MATEPCKMCPLLRSTPRAHRGLLVEGALGRIAEHRGFPCHEKHPQAHALVPGPYATCDCVGYAMMQANKVRPGRFPQVVQDWLEE